MPRPPTPRRLAVERLGLLPRTRLRHALVPLVTLADVVVAALCLLGVVAVLQYDLLVALAAGQAARLEGYGGSWGALRALGGTLVVVGSLGALGGLSLLRLRWTEPGSWRHLLVFGLSCLVCVGAARILLALDAAVAPEWRRLVYLTPLAALSMVLTVLYGQRRAVAASLLIALLVGLAVRIAPPTPTVVEPLPIVVVLLCGALVAVLGSVRIRKRMKLLGVGLGVGLVHGAVLLGFELLRGRLPIERAASSALLYSAASGLGAGVLLTLALPFIELLFGVATDIRLLELSDQEHPLLRSLVALAPGTDHHSRRVALLANAAAEAVRANPLLARVGAYYHDIGKTLKPRYFIENLSGRDSPHERLRPTLSTLIIAAHTKDGAELAEHARLPRPIADIVAQHHGTSVIEFFYHRYLQDAGKAEHLDETFFRYPGPKPRSREAAIVLLADAVEAASRTLEEPLPARIRTLIRRITSNKLHDGQLDESALTLSDLHAIEDSFFRVLCAMHHPRVEYPATELDATGRRRGGTRDA